MSSEKRVERFTEVLNVMNAALAEHGDDTPYKQILGAAKKWVDDTKFGVAVYRDDPSTPFDYFTVRFRDGRLEFVSHGKQEPETTWKVSQDYLDKVRNHPGDYIAHPAKLDWDWLKDRLGVN